LLLEQKPQKLYQERFFKMEHALVTAAHETEVPASAKLIGTNLCHYALVGRGRVEFTQSYVKVSGDMPIHAAFRKQLAEMAEFKRAPRLDLGDVPSDLIEPGVALRLRLPPMILDAPFGIDSPDDITESSDDEETEDEAVEGGEEGIEPDSEDLDDNP
jgi:hypothetical protein